MTGKQLLDYLSKCTSEQLSMPVYFEENVDDEDGGYSVMKELDDCNFYEKITDPDYNRNDGRVLKGFECHFSLA